MNNIDKLAWIHIQNNKLLVVRSHNKNLYYLPGGKRDSGETDNQALTREIHEELSVTISQKSIKKLGVYSAQADGKAAGIKVQLTCYFAEFEGKLLPAAEIAEMAWHAYADIDKLSLAAQVVMTDLHQKGYLS